VVRGGLVEGAVEFHERHVREVLTPRHRVVALPARANLLEALQTVRESGHSRFPVYDRDPEDVVGFVYAREIYDAALQDAPLDLARLTRGGLVVPENKPATELLAEMRKGGIPIAAVVDEHGTLSGIVTIEDLVEVIVGEIPDEHRAAEPLVAAVSEGVVEADGSMPVHELNGDHGLRLPESDEYVSLAGLILHRLGTLPRPGQTLEVDGHALTVIRMHGPRVRRVRVVLPPAAQVGRTAEAAPGTADTRPASR
jgi:putative hemolysin